MKTKNNNNAAQAAQTVPEAQNAQEPPNPQAIPETQGEAMSITQESPELARTYKDSVFVTIFHDKTKLIELYNALFDTDYDENTPIDIVTIKDVLFRTLKNDVAFVMDGRFVVLVEHQSSINENMPLRDLLYIATVLKRMVDSSRLYREKRLMIPRPQFVVFYNGTKDFPAYQELKLSDSFLGKPQKNEVDALQLIVQVYNINTEKNSEILKKCETLRQYSRFVEVMRSYKETAELTNEVIVKIISQCKGEGVLTEFLDKYGTEIVEMLFKELTREEDLEISRLDGYDEGERVGFTKGEQSGIKLGFSKGEKSGIKLGAAQKEREIAKNFKKSGIPLDVIAKNTGLSLSEVAEL